jgi:hypothetical protein
VKAILCAVVGGVHICSPGINRWKLCDCGNSAARWDNPEEGRLAVAARPSSRRYIRGLGLNNRLLLPLFATEGLAWGDFREWHEMATSAPGHVFDRTRGACWAVPFLIGSTSDTRWADDGETAEALRVQPEEERNA